MSTKKTNLREQHGQSKSRLYGIWGAMKGRCKGHGGVLSEKYYGGRISVCQEWSDSFVAFRSWAMANGYSDSLEIDRINPSGNYEPGNCRWANREQQARNVRKRKTATTTSKFKGVSKHTNRGKWAAMIQCSKKTFYLGLHTTPLAAARAYDRAAMEKFGNYARVNFPEAFRTKNTRGSVAK